MLTIEDVIKEVSNRTQIDKELVSIVCKHPFNAIVEIMKNDDEYRDILLNGFIKFKLKSRYKKDKTKPYKVR